MILPVFTGYDSREAIGWHAFIQSLIETSTDYVLAPPLSGKQGDGTNLFTYQRFMVPELCQWSGMALWLDGADMLLRADIAGLGDLFEPRYAVQVVKHFYKTKHARKYIGTEMEANNEDYERKNWSSLILFNCGHRAHFKAREEIREAVGEGNGKFLHRFGWLKDKDIGELPIEWNWLPQELGDNPQAKLVHYTLGIPGFKHYASDPMSNLWHETAKTLHSQR